MKLITAILVTGLLLPTAAHGKAYFAPKAEMISNSVVIAVVDITDVKSLEPKAQYGDQLATATVNQTLAGRARTNINFRVPCFFPCAITQVSNGTYLVFLSKGNHGLQGCNWHLSYRPVKDGKIEWYGNKSPHELEWRAKEDVLREVKEEVAKAHDGVVPFGKQQTRFSQWIRPGDFELQLEKISDKRYPMVIEGGPLEGDGVVYRMLLMDKPTRGLQSEFVYGVKEREYDQRHQELHKKGYVLIQHQVVQLISFKAHQAVWVKND
jgi:hypothetical protein